MDAIVSFPALFAKNHDAITLVQIALDQLLKKIMTDHAMADNHQNWLVH